MDATGYQSSKCFFLKGSLFSAWKHEQFIKPKKKFYTLRIDRRPFYWKIFNVNFKTWNIVFFGSDNFSIVSLKELVKQRNQVVGNLEVVTTSTSTIVYKFSSNNGIKIHLWPPQLKGSFDIGVVASFGKLIPNKLIDFFPLGIINIHASLLPKWRGAMPIFHSIKNGDSVTGVTIHNIKAGAFDTGDIIYKKTVPIGKNEVLPSLHKKLSLCGGQCLLKIVQGLPESLKMSEPQSNEQASYAKKIPKEAAVVRWEKYTAEEIYNLYRAFMGTEDLKTTWKKNFLKIKCLSLPNDHTQATSDPGSIVFDRQTRDLLVYCKDRPLKICTVLFKGKLYTAEQFHRGFLCTSDSDSIWKFGD